MRSHSRSMGKPSRVSDSFYLLKRGWWKPHHQSEPRHWLATDITYIQLEQWLRLSDTPERTSETVFTVIAVVMGTCQDWERGCSIALDYGRLQFDRVLLP